MYDGSISATNFRSLNLIETCTNRLVVTRCHCGYRDVTSSRGLHCSSSIWIGQLLPGPVMTLVGRAKNGLKFWRIILGHKCVYSLTDDLRIVASEVSCLSPYFTVTIKNRKTCSNNTDTSLSHIPLYTPYTSSWFMSTPDHRAVPCRV